jgi:actin-related protein
MARDSFPIAGNDITNYFLNLILNKQKDIFLEKWLVKEIKEKTSLCVLKYKDELKQIKKGFTNYDQIINFPDGNSIEINYERFMLTEPFFDPKLIHMDYIGIGEVIANVIKTWDRENWEELIANIILSGGGSLIPGLKERLANEMTGYFSDKIKSKIKVIAVPGRENMAWLGGSVLYSKNQLKGWIENPKIKSSNEQTNQNLND